MQQVKQELKQNQERFEAFKKASKKKIEQYKQQVDGRDKVIESLES